jgi:hypothetical protein
MKIQRAWAMPNKHTFSIKPIGQLVQQQIDKYSGGVIVDPFANNSCFNANCTFTNDIDPDANTTHHMDALEFLKSLDSNSVDLVLFDPPYSPGQVSECYKSLGLTVNMQTTQASFWGNLKKEISRVTKQGGSCITFGWNSGGVGKSSGFEITEILMVAHGGWHNDTICTVEVKSMPA